MGLEAPVLVLSFGYAYSLELQATHRHVAMAAKCCNARIPLVCNLADQHLARPAPDNMDPHRQRSHEAKNKTVTDLDSAS